MNRLKWESNVMKQNCDTATHCQIDTEAKEPSWYLQQTHKSTIRTGNKSMLKFAGMPARSIARRITEAESCKILNRSIRGSYQSISDWVVKAADPNKIIWVGTRGVGEPRTNNVASRACVPSMRSPKVLKSMTILIYRCTIIEVPLGLATEIWGWLCVPNFDHHCRIIAVTTLANWGTGTIGYSQTYIRAICASEV